MAYLVLARKYRPQKFGELVGQEHVARTLTNAIEAKRVHHAFLFTGARGVGKTSAARILAKALACERGPTANPCGECEQCQEIAGGRSVDVIEIDGASNTGVDDVRTLREGTRYLPQKARLKIYIIDEVHMLSSSAFNALLKTLEEPPPHVVFIFATTEAHKIPMTILSRCQRYDFKLLSTAALTAHLQGILAAEGIASDVDGLRLLARQAAGSVRDGLSLLDQVIAYVGVDDNAGRITSQVVSEVLGIADRAVLGDLARAVLGRDAAAALRTLGGAAERGLDLGQLSRAFLGWLRDVEVVARVTDAGQVADLVDATSDELAELRAFARSADRLAPVMFDRWARAVDEASRAFAPRLILEMALVDLCQAEPLEPLGDLLDRLEALENRLQRGLPASPRAAAATVATGPAGNGRAPAAAPRPLAASAAAAPTVVGNGTTPAIATRPAAPEAPPPPSVAVPAPAAVRATAPSEAWRRVKAELETRRPRVASALAGAHVLQIDETSVVLGFGDRVDVEAVERARGEIEQGLSAEMGSPMRLTAKLHEAGQAAPVIRADTVEEAEALKADKGKREQEARAHPIIQKAQDLFGVPIREIKT